MMHVQSDEARRRLREILNAVEHDGEHVTVQRYGTPAVVIVPVEWHKKAVAALGEEAQR
jgi:prevent-host-death family protein